MRISFYEEIDVLLGNRESRYFGDGYLKTNYAIEHFKFLDGYDGLSFSCVGKVLLPEIWSTKGDVIQTPHLSTIDVIELALESLRHLMLHTFHGKFLSASGLKNITIIAGKNPVESELESVLIEGKVDHTDSGVFVLELAIANMKLQLTCSSQNHIQSPRISSHKHPVKVSNIMSLANEQRTAACGLVTPLNHHEHEAWSISSCFAVSLQLGQALLYELDGIKRADSNTLWMKKTSISLTSGLSAYSGLPQPVFTHLENTRRYTKEDGDWRRADICSLLCNASIICSVTHKLPLAAQPSPHQPEQ